MKEILYSIKILKIEINEPKIRKYKGYPYCKGKITIGNFQEGFRIFLDSWNLKEYKKQWKEGLERIKTHNESCLIADISIFENNINMQIYYLYKVNSKILVQYQMYRPEIFKDLINEPLPFDPFIYENRYRNLHPLELKNEDGDELETWEADLDGIFIE